MDQSGKKIEKTMESDYAVAAACTKEPTVPAECFVTNARNLTFAMGVNEFSFSPEESGAVRTRQGSTSTYCVMKTIDGNPRLVPREVQQL